MRNDIFQQLKRQIPEIKKNILLKNYTTFRIGGPAKYFFVAKNKKDLISAIKVAKKLNLPFFVLGGGSNLLASDKEYKGLIIKIQNTKYKILNTKIVAEAGIMLGELVNAAANAGLVGLEWAVGIPGTVGGAIRGNTGAFGKSMAFITKTVTVLEIENQKVKVKIFKNSACQFSYRDSIFKKNPNLIILSAIFQLKKGNKKVIQKRIKEYLNYRKKTQPLNFPSAGSIFKNPSPSKILKKIERVNFSVGELIEKCGLKGKKIRKAQISKIHANFIVNLGGASAKDVKKLINLAKKMVKNKFGIEPKEEIEYLGFKN